MFSEFLPHSIGVPQGRNFGPLFFLIFFSDLLYSLDCSIEAYADDSTMVATGESVEDISETLTRNCETVVSWMGSNKLKINADKSHCWDPAETCYLTRPNEGNNGWYRIARR